MTHILQMYKNLPFDNATRMPLFTSLSAQNAYMSSHTDRSTEVNFNKIGDPIVVQLSYEEAIAYSYGRISFGSKWIYFSVTDVNVIQEGKVEISYKIDAWATGRYQYSVSLGRTQVTRRNMTGSHPKQPIEPIDMRLVSAQSITQNKKTVVFVLSQLKFTADGTYNTGPFYCAIENIGDPTEFLFKTFVDSGYFATSDIIGAWLTPFDYTEFIEWQNITEGTSEMKWTLGSWGMPHHHFTFNTLSTTDLTQGVITDERGNILYTLPYNRSVSEFDAYLRVSASTCQVAIRFNDTPYTTADNKGFAVACLPLDVVIDSWADYCARNRQYEKDLRTLQNQKAVVSSLTGVGESGMQGAVAGGLTKAGGPAGTIAGLGISVGSALLSYGLNNYYDPKFQSLEDAKYRQAQDTLSLAGDTLTDATRNNAFLYAIELQADQYTRERYNDIILNGGYYCNEYYSSGEFLMTPQPLQCNAEIIGELPDNWRAQIYQRFATGVKLIEVA